MSEIPRTSSSPTDADPSATSEAPVPRPRRWLRVLLPLCALAVFGVATVVSYTLTPPRDFPVNTAVTIPTGEGVRGVVEQLAAEGYTRSPFGLYLAIVLFHDPREIKASTYVFSQPLGTLGLAARLTEGDYGNNLIRFTHIEGERVEQLAARAEAALTGFDAEYFREIATPYEGRLFPDTYFLPPNFSEEALASLLRESFTERIEPYADAIRAHELTESEIIILASILEREANSPESMRTVSDILQRRLAEGMPLQADATIEYVLKQPLNELPPGVLAENLRERESPYNTYRTRGLPPTPIGNPGLTAIAAVLDPIPTEFRFYLTAPDGTFHYAKTYAEHQRNIERHLRE